MSITSWLSSLKKPHRRKNRKLKSYNTRLNVDLLEDRYTPATLITTTAMNQFTSGINNQGWWSNVASASNSNSNQYTGTLSGAEYRSFFSFDLASLPSGTTVTAATFTIFTADVITPDGSETIVFRDVLTSAATVNNNNGTNAAIFNDLGTGNAYGSVTLTPAQSNTNVDVSLGSAAFTDIATAAGGFFSIGGALSTISGGSDQSIFSSSSNTTFTLTITYSPPNSAPTALNISNLSLAENAGVNAVVGNFSTTDPDAGNTFTYTLVSGAGSTDNGLFNISGNQLRANASFDFESGSSYTVRVRTTDQGGLFTEQAFAITITNVNETPTALNISNQSLAENAGVNALVGNFSSTDPDAGNTFTYTLVSGAGSTNNGLFNISGNQLRANASFDFEAGSSYTVRVRTTDQGGLFTEQAFAITITNVNETPTALNISNQSLAENAGVNALVGNFSSTDPDAGNTFTYTLVSGAGSTNNGLFNISGNQLRANASFDFEAGSSYSVRVRTTDQGGLFTEQAFAITITNVNETPTALNISNQSLAENAGVNALVGNFSSTDPDAGNTFTYTLVSGAGSTNNGLFNISGNQLRANASFNYEAGSSYTVRVRTTDQGGLFTEQPFAITITDVNETPIDITTAGLTIPENSPNTTAVGSVSGVDPDTGAPFNTLSYSLTNNAGGRFAIQPSTGAVTVANGSLLNYEANFSHLITVRVTDGGSPGLFFDKDFTVNVTDVNETPTALAMTNQELCENAGINAFVGQFVTTDPDIYAPQTFTYTFVSGTGDTDNSLFNISGNNLRANASFNFEVQNSYTVRIRTTDQGGLYTEQDFIITVDDAEEMPPMILASRTNNTVEWLDATGNVVHTVTVPAAFIPGSTVRPVAALGDRNGDNFPDFVIARGTGAASLVGIVDGKNGSVLWSTSPYGTFTGGVNVAVGDVNGDCMLDIITGAGAGGGPHVKVYNGVGFGEIRSFYAYASSFRGGVQVAAGDTNQDGHADIITGPGQGGGPNVRVFNGSDTPAIGVAPSMLMNFYAFASTFTGGVSVAGGDFDGDGYADIAAGTLTGGSRVRVFSGNGGAMMVDFNTTVRLESVFVGMRDFDMDGKFQLVTLTTDTYSLLVAAHDFNNTLTPSTIMTKIYTRSVNQYPAYRIG